MKSAGGSTSSDDDFIFPTASGVERDHGTTAASAGGRMVAAIAPARGCFFGPDAPAMAVTPRSINDHRRQQQPHASAVDQEILKPLTGMTIRLTPEIFALLQAPGPRPRIELVLKSKAEGGAVFIVGGVTHNMNAHQMAVRSEVDMLATTRIYPAAAAAGPGYEGNSATAAGADGEAGSAGMSIFASLHRKLIVQQVMTETKRADIRARNDEISRREREAKRKTVRMEDQEEMLAAAEAIPVPLSQTQQQQERLKEHGVGSGRQGPAAAAEAAVAEGADGDDQGGEQHGRRRRCRRRTDPLTAWVCGCYNSDDYAGHVSDLRHFFRGIDFHHVMFRYHVNPDGTLHPDRRRFCVKFKTKAGRDLAVKRSGEALGSYCSWWDPEDVAVVVRGRDEVSHGDGGGIGCGRVRGGGDYNGVNDLLLVLPHGRSVADVLEKVRTRLPPDLTPALAGRQREDDEGDRGNGHAGSGSHHAKGRRRRSGRDQQERHENQVSRDGGHEQGTAARRWRELEAYRRDMLRAALSANLAEARALGPKRGAPAGAVRAAGTDENNAWRVATLASSEAARELDAAIGSIQGVGKRNSSGVNGARERTRKWRRSEGGGEGGGKESVAPATAAAAPAARARAR